MRMRIALRQFPATGERAAPLDRDMSVLADEERFEATGLESACELAYVDAVVGREIECADKHGLSSVASLPACRERQIQTATNKLPQLLTPSIRIAITG